MKTITNTYNVYTIQELSKEAQEKAHQQWIDNEDYDFLEDDLTYHANELLKENNIQVNNDITVYYSLSNCQGDGVMFEGNFDFKGRNITVKHSGRYYHYNSKDITFNDFVGEDKETEEEKIAEEFNTLYVSICKELERYGYDCMDTQNSFENFVESCDANEYTFTIDGVMDNQ